MSMSADLTINETALLAGVPRSRVEKSIERSIATPVRSKAPSKGASVRLPVAAVAFFRAMEVSGAADLPAKVRRAAWRTILRDCRARVVLGEGLVLDVPSLSGEALDRATTYARAKSEFIVADPTILGGTPVIRGTRLNVHAIKARLDGGETVDDLLLDYPDVPREAFEAARLFATANPLRGRPAGRPWRKAPPAEARG